MARLRLAALLLQAKDYDGALKQLDGATAPTFAALVADRRGDVLMAQGKPDEARTAYQAAWKAMDDKLEYRASDRRQAHRAGGAAAAGQCRGGRGRRSDVRWWPACAGHRAGLWPALAGALLAACAGDKPKPTPLANVAPKIAGRQVWSVKLDSVKFPLTMLVRNGNFIVASTDGTLLALEANSGRSCFAPTSAHRSAPASAATAASTRW